MLHAVSSQCGEERNRSQRTPSPNRCKPESSARSSRPAGDGREAPCVSRATEGVARKSFERSGRSRGDYAIVKRIVEYDIQKTQLKRVVWRSVFALVHSPP